MHIEEHLAQLTKALAVEKKHDQELYDAMMSRSSLSDIVAKGVCWYPLSIVERGFTIGEYPFIIIEFDEKKMTHHQFKTGSIVSLFHNVDGNIQLESTPGSVHYMAKNQMKIILNEDDYPEWIDDGKIGVHLGFDDNSYTEMEKALAVVSKAKDNRIAELRDRIYAKKPVQGQCLTFFAKNKSLNPSQIAAVEGVLGTEDVAIIHGPPGTGKTTTLVESIVQLVQKGNKILVTAPSNAAVDLLVEKIAEQELQVLRLGHLSRINPEIIAHTLDYLVAHSPEFNEIKKLRKQAEEYSRLAHKYKRNFGKEEREQRYLLMKEAKECRKHARLVEDYITSSIKEKTQVFCTTLVGSENKLLKDLQFDFCIVDEAAQALEPATWIPMLKAQKVILAGDPFQLPPTVKSFEAEKMGFSKTLMERAISLPHNVFLLDTQYRMNEEIMTYSNRYFYGGRLRSNDNVRWHYFVDHPQSPILFIDTAGCGFEEKQNDQSLSLYNPEECYKLFDFIEQMLSSIYQNYTEPISIAVISPYRQQVQYMKEQDAQNLNLTQKFGLEIQTIDSFQGQERDIVCISAVRSNDQGEIGFLKDYRRMNVAMTRAKKMLIVMGDSATLGADPFYEGFITYCQEQNGYMSAWELMG